MSFLKKLLGFHAFVAISSILLYYYKPGLIANLTKLEFLQKPAHQERAGTIRLFTAEELAKYDSNVNDQEIYLSILGSVYDITEGKKHYGKGCSYGFFTGKDASVSFVTGDFDTFSEFSDDVASLKPADILSLQKWKKFYDETYPFKGHLIGRFYDDSGTPTNYFRKVEALAGVGEYQKRQEQERNAQFPPCNIEWSADTGTRVWCTTESGGLPRRWVGVPRKYFEPGQTSYRCACVQSKDLSSTLLKPYDDCDDDATECFYTVD